MASYSAYCYNAAAYINTELLKYTPGDFFFSFLFFEDFGILWGLGFFFVPWDKWLCGLKYGSLLSLPVSLSSPVTSSLGGNEKDSLFSSSSSLSLAVSGIASVFKSSQVNVLFLTRFDWLLGMISNNIYECQICLKPIPFSESENRNASKNSITFNEYDIMGKTYDTRQSFISTLHMNVYKLELYNPWNVSKWLSIFQTSTSIINKISIQLTAISLLCLCRYCCYAPNTGHCLKVLWICVTTQKPVNTFQQTRMDPTVKASWSEDLWSIHTRQTIFIINILVGLTLLYKTNIINFVLAIMAIFIKI